IQGLPPSSMQATPASELMPVEPSLSPVLIIFIASKEDLKFHRPTPSSECPGSTRIQSPSSRNCVLVRARSPRRRTIGHNPIMRAGHRFSPRRCVCQSLSTHRHPPSSSSSSSARLGF
ncbi:hypothetical protein Dimus_024484, partial [Dionaea muscipula]